LAAKKYKYPYPEARDDPWDIGRRKASLRGATGGRFPQARRSGTLSVQSLMLSEQATRKGKP